MRDDHELIAAAKTIIGKRFRADWHVVGAALRLETGEIVTGVHLEANVGRVAVCAEAIALGRAVTEYGSSAITSIVAVYHAEDGTITLVPPCGMCREMITDYAPHAHVLLPDPASDQGYRSSPISTLLPCKYQSQEG